jgi:hypothetical protein
VTKPGTQFLGTFQARDPACASAGEMIERREHPRDMKRLGDVARPPAAEADPLGGADHRAQQGQCIEPYAIDRATIAPRPRSRRHTQQHRIEAASLGRLRHRPERRGAAEACRIRHAPRTGMPAVGRERSQEMHRYL